MKTHHTDTRAGKGTTYGGEDDGQGGGRESTKLGQKLRPGIVLRGGGEEGKSQSKEIHKKNHKHHALA